MVSSIYVPPRNRPNGTGRTEIAVIAAAEGAELLVLARDGDPSRLSPRNISPVSRYVIDHAPCPILRIGIGLTVTLEFLGPLTVALAGALTTTPTGVRRRITVACALLAAAGVLVLTRPQPATDYLGIGLGLLAAACWATYILINRTVGQRFTGVRGIGGGSFGENVRRWGLLALLGTVGDCYDNAAMESFWGRLQVELLNTRKLATTLELAAAIADYIDNFYNVERRHSYLGNISPTEYETLWTSTYSIPQLA